jgi:cell division GTPase FtsZ
MGTLTSQTTSDCPAYLSVSDCWDVQCDAMVEAALKSLWDTHSVHPALKRLIDIAQEYEVDLTEVNGTQALFEQFSNEAEAIGEMALRDRSKATN